MQSSLATAADLAEQADAEIYIRRKRKREGRRGGAGAGAGAGRPPPLPPARHLFLPGPGPWTPAAWRALPKPEVERACSALRKVGRALGALHACRPRGGDERSWGGSGGGGGRGGGESGSSDGSGSDGRDGAFPDPSASSSPSPARALAAAYPAGLLRGAAEDCVSALRLAAANVPGPPPAEARAAAAAFGARAAALLRISDYNRRALARAAARGARGRVNDAAAAVAANDDDEEGGEEGVKKKNANRFGSPSEAFELLPDSLTVDLTGEGSGVGAGSSRRERDGAAATEAAAAAAAAAKEKAPPPPAPSSSSSSLASSATPRVRVQLRRLNSSQVAAAAFPPTAAGFEAQVRWYSLQLALQELSEGVGEMLASLEALAGALPGPLAVAVPRTAK